MRLLDFGCGIDTKDYDGSTAIHSAVEGGHTDAVSFLLHRGADVHATNTYHDSALHFAARDGALASTAAAALPRRRSHHPLAAAHSRQGGRSPRVPASCA